MSSDRRKISSNVLLCAAVLIVCPYYTASIETIFPVASWDFSELHHTNLPTSNAKMTLVLGPGVEFVAHSYGPNNPASRAVVLNSSDTSYAYITNPSQFNISQGQYTIYMGGSLDWRKHMFGSTAGDRVLLDIGGYIDCVPGRTYNTETAVPRLRLIVDLFPKTRWSNGLKLVLNRGTDACEFLYVGEADPSFNFDWMSLGLAIKEISTGVCMASILEDKRGESSPTYNWVQTDNFTCGPEISQLKDSIFIASPSRTDSYSTGSNMLIACVQIYDRAMDDSHYNIDICNSADDSRTASIQLFDFVHIDHPPESTTAPTQATTLEETSTQLTTNEITTDITTEEIDNTQLTIGTTGSAVVTDQVTKITDDISTTEETERFTVLTDTPQATPDCGCVCDAGITGGKPPKYYTPDELNQAVEKIHKELFVDPETTSAVKRKKTSAVDKRTSSQVLGTTLGVAFCSVVIFFIVLVDSLNLCA